MINRQKLSFNQEILLNNLPEFASSADREARRFFNRLDRNLDPQIILLAIPFQKDSTPTVIQPERCNYIPDWFIELQGTVEFLPESYLTDLAFDAQGVVWQEKVNVKSKLQKLLDSKLRKSERCAFTTFPEFMHGYCVSFVVDISRIALRSHYALLRDTRWGYQGVSLIYETIAAFLYSCLPSLRDLASGRTWFHLSENGDDMSLSPFFRQETGLNKIVSVTVFKRGALLPLYTFQP